jgi:hypothetical protein
MLHRCKQSERFAHPGVRSTRWWSNTGCAAALLVATNASGAYPERPLRYIVPQAPGSASDVSAEGEAGLGFSLHAAMVSARHSQG